MNIIETAFFGFGVLCGAFLTLVTVVTIMEHYDRMEDDENEAD